jgi:hypothetical protein
LKIDCQSGWEGLSLRGVVPVTQSRGPSYQWLVPENGRHKPNVRCRCVIVGLGQCWRPWWRRDRVGRSSSSSSSGRRRRVARSEPRQKRNEACAAAAVELPAGGHPGNQPELRVQSKALQVIECATHTHAYTCTSAPILCVCLSHCNSPQFGILINASTRCVGCPTHSPTHQNRSPTHRDDVHRPTLCACGHRGVPCMHACMCIAPLHVDCCCCACMHGGGLPCRPCMC